MTHPNPSDSRQERIIKMERDTEIQRQLAIIDEWSHGLRDWQMCDTQLLRVARARSELSQLRNESGGGEAREEGPRATFAYAQGAQWCQPGDVQERRWIVRFDDANRRDAVFTDGKEAREFWDKANLSWNCYLFATEPLSTPAPQPDVAPRLAQEGHNEPCYYCGEPCNSFAGNPGLWPIPLCHKDDPGVMKWHHTNCVSERLNENVSQPDALRKALEEAAKICDDYGREGDVLSKAFECETADELAARIRALKPALSTPAPAQSDDGTPIGEIPSRVRFTENADGDLKPHFSFPKALSPDDAIQVVRRMHAAIGKNLELAVACPLHSSSFHEAAQSDERAGLERAANVGHETRWIAWDFDRLLKGPYLDQQAGFNAARELAETFPGNAIHLLKTVMVTETPLRSLAQGDRSDG